MQSERLFRLREWGNVPTKRADHSGKNRVEVSWFAHVFKDLGKKIAQPTHANPHLGAHAIFAVHVSAQFDIADARASGSKWDHDIMEVEKIVSPDYDTNNHRDRILSADEIRELHQILREMREYFGSAMNRWSTSGRWMRQPSVQSGSCSRRCAALRALDDTLGRRRPRKGEWFIPREDTNGKKNNFIVFLPPFALAQFNALTQVTGKTDWCFPGRALTVMWTSGPSASRWVTARRDSKKAATARRADKCQIAAFINNLVLAGGRSDT